MLKKTKFLAMVALALSFTYCQQPQTGKSRRLDSKVGAAATNASSLIGDHFKDYSPDYRQEYSSLWLHVSKVKDDNTVGGAGLALTADTPAVAAKATVTIDATKLADGDTLTIGSETFTAKNAVVDPMVTGSHFSLDSKATPGTPAGNAEVATNLAFAINVIAGMDPADPSAFDPKSDADAEGVYGTAKSETVEITAATAGSDGNNIAISFTTATSGGLTLDAASAGSGYLMGGAAAGVQSASGCANGELMVNGKCQSQDLFCQQYNDGRHTFVPKYTGGAGGPSLPGLNLTAAKATGTFTISAQTGDLAVFIEYAKRDNPASPTSGNKATYDAIFYTGTAPSHTDADVGSYSFTKGADVTATATALKDAINAAGLKVTATSSAGVVTLTATEDGIRSNAYYLSSKTGEVIASGYLTGGDSDSTAEHCVVDQVLSCDPHEAVGTVTEQIAYLDAQGQERTSTLSLSVCKPNKDNCNAIKGGELRQTGGTVLDIDNNLVSWGKLTDQSSQDTCLLTQKYCDVLEQGLFHADLNRCMVSVKACHLEGKLKAGAKCVERSEFKAGPETCSENGMEYDGYRCYPKDQALCENFGMIWVPSQEERDKLKAKRKENFAMPDTKLSNELLTMMYVHECQEPDESWCSLKDMLFDSKERKCVKTTKRTLNILPKTLKLKTGNACAGSVLDDYESSKIDFEFAVTVTPFDAVDKGPTNGYLKIADTKINDMRENDEAALSKHNKAYQLTITEDGSQDPLKMNFTLTAEADNGGLGSVAQAFAYRGKSDAYIKAGATSKTNVSNYIIGHRHEQTILLEQNRLDPAGWYGDQWCRIELTYEWYWSHPKEESE